MNFNKDGTRKEDSRAKVCKKPAHYLCSDECLDSTNDMIDEQEKVMNEQPPSQPFHPTELVSLPSYVTDIEQGMLPCDQEMLTFIEEDHQHQIEREMVEKEAYLDEMEEMLYTIPSTQPAFEPDDIFTPIQIHNHDDTSILACDSQRTVSLESADESTENCFV